MPGAKSLFDDFVAIHLMQTMNIHLSVCLPHPVPVDLRSPPC
jgi:hypothetical protein